LYDDTATRDIFLDGMSAGSLLAAKALANRFPWRDFGTVIDVGTAQGCVPVEIARLHSHLTGGGFDLPPIERSFASYVDKYGLSHRLRFYPGDFFTDPLPAADVLVMGRILHNWDVPTRKLLIRKAYRALPPGGALIVYEPLISDARRGDAHGLLSSLNMLIETTDGHRRAPFGNQADNQGPKHDTLIALHCNDPRADRTRGSHIWNRSSTPHEGLGNSPVRGAPLRLVNRQ
jgi:SAM-dependent methyltransferase